MHMAYDKWHVGRRGAWLLGSIVLAWPMMAVALQVTPPPAVQFQQQMQQHQVRDQLQKRQLESSLQQTVSDQSRRDQADDALTRRQRAQADQARRDRERAAQRDLLDRSLRATPPLPQSPSPLIPAPTSSG